ncbi:MAG: esterase/lipase [Acidimicrobiia bacterium]|nr:esterase/lipase [Acidimicrobiia bacterium]
MSAPASSALRAADDLTTEVIGFTAGDGMALNLHHVTGSKPATRGPVLLVHGAGVRANIFRPPEPVNFVRALIDDGHDVWLENWRASIDVPANRWDLDQAAVYDHPVAVDTVLRLTGADTLKAVVHCQGSTSFTLAAVSGLLPRVDTIVSNAVSLHPIVPTAASLKIRLVAPQMARYLDYLDPQWALRPPEELLPKAIVAAVRLSHHECHNMVCRMVSFTYGVGHPALWSHSNLSDATHHWLTGEFAAVPLRFFLQMGRSISRGHLLTADDFPTLPTNPTAGPPQTDARFALFAGQDNRCFLPSSQERTFAFLDGHRPNYHRLHVVPGYGHLDMFMGQRAASDVFPLMLQELH